MRAEAKDRRAELVECLSNVDETIGEIFLNDKVPTTEEIHASVRRMCLERKFVPVFCGSALKNKGVQPLMDGIIKYLPNPSEIKNYANKQEGDKTIKVEMDPSRSGDKPFVGLAFKLESGRFGQLVYIRAYQGTLCKGDFVYNTRTGQKVS